MEKVISKQNPLTLQSKCENNAARMHYRILKRGLDFFLAFSGIIFLLPILLMIVITIYIDSPGSAIYASRRIGKGGKGFCCYKFRSMKMDAEEALKRYLARSPEAREEWNSSFKLKNDPRITKFGSFLRKTSLDELPQLFNVLKGDMSLVGPRPMLPDEEEKYGEYLPLYYSVRPGITGYWQVYGRSDTSYAERLEMVAWYVYHRSLRLDIVLLVKTISVVLGRRGAY